MTRPEFNQSFNPLVKALQAKVNVEQAQVFFDEFQHHDKRDFAHACRELSMGNAAYGLPKILFFRDNVITAREMREQAAKGQKEQEASQFWRGGHLQDMTPEEAAEGKAQLQKLKVLVAKTPMWLKQKGY